ncbi:hypothetical protein C6497_00820 [Candidatus Poribacteria bacterium]|nr:MAG: hypothetical protein C6497_00820 [Candidatus Poribacteria bacterium]
MRVYLYLFLLTCILFSGCWSVKIDGVILDTQIQNAQDSISKAAELDAEQLASDEYSRAIKLLKFSQQAQESGDFAQSMEFAYQSELVGYIALYQAKQQQFRQQLISTKELIYEEQLTQKDLELDMEKTRNEIKSIEVEQALQKFEEEQQNAGSLTTELTQTTKTLRQTEISVPITGTEIYVRIATQLFPEIINTPEYEKVQSNIKLATSHLEREEFTEAEKVASDAQTEANALFELAILKQTEENTAKIAALISIIRVEVKAKRAEALNAATHAPQQFQELQNQLENANKSFEENDYEKAMQIATAAEPSADKVISTAETSEYRQRAQQEQAAKVKRAQQAVSNLKTAIAEQTETKVPQFAPQLFELATAALTSAETALATKEYAKVVETAQAGQDYLKRAIDKTENQGSAQEALVEAVNTIQKATITDLEEGVLVRISGRLFATTSTQLNKAFFPTFMQLASVLQQDELKDYVIKIEGHSDSLGDAKTNEALTEKRADSIKQFLVDKGKISVDRITAIGLGESKPIDKNSEAKNRRIDIYIRKP